MKIKFTFSLLILISCSKSIDTKIAPSSTNQSTSNSPDPNFPVPSLLGTWSLGYEKISDCGQYNQTHNYIQLGNPLPLMLSSIKSDDGNYKAGYEGISTEYQLKGDSIFLFTPSYSSSGIFQKMVSYKKGIYILTDTLFITGKYTIINQLTGCTFSDHYYK